MLFRSQNGSLHRPDGSRSQIISFDTYTINIPLQTPTILDGQDVTQLSAKSMTLGQLQNSATILGRETDEGRNRLIHFHKRLVLPLGCFILSLLGLPLGLLAGPGKKAIGIPLGLGFFILYYILFTLGKTLADDTQLPVVFAMWLPNAVFLVLMVYAIRQAAREQPAIPTPIKNYAAATVDKLVQPVQKQFRKIIKLFKSEEQKHPKAVSNPIQATSLAPKKVPIDQEASTFLTEGTVHGNVNSQIGRASCRERV